MRNTWPQIIKLIIVLTIMTIGTYKTLDLSHVTNDDSAVSIKRLDTPAGQVLGTLTIKGRAPKTGYTRDQFGSGWGEIQNCDLRNYILVRDLRSETVDPRECIVTSGILVDPYSAKEITFTRGAESSDDVQIDHVVALSDAWQKGAQQLTYDQRVALANDPLELLAVDGGLNQAKGDGDAATWLPPNKAYRCEYVARQIAVKKKYSLWVTRSEYDAMTSILKQCPDQTVPTY
jgi:hypothetical protein